MSGAMTDRTSRAESTSVSSTDAMAAVKTKYGRVPPSWYT